MPILAPPPAPPASPPVPRMPAVSVLAGFGATGGQVTWTDISAYARSGSITRPCTRLAGPLYQYQAGTATIVLKNDTGRFDADNLAGPYTSSTGLQVVTKTFFASGTWTAPANLATGTVKVECWGGGGAGYSTVSAGTGNGASGGGGGEYAAEPALAVTPGHVYSYTVGGPGQAATSGNGTDGGNTTFAGDTVTVTAHGGGHGTPSGVGGHGGSGSLNTIHFAGGNGGTNGSFGQPGFNGGAGGGGSGAPSGAGNPGNNTTSDNGATGGTALPDGGPGGNGGSNGINGAHPPAGPGGGAGGGWSNFTNTTDGGNGYRGRIRVTWTVSIPGAATTQVLPMVPIRVQATWNSITYNLFTGYATGWADAGINNPRYAEVTLSATDGMYVLAGVTFPSVSAVGAGEDTGSRVSRVLDAAGWPDTQRNIDTGDSVLTGETFGDTALARIQTAAETEAGEFYIDGSGNATFRHRQAIFEDLRSTVVQTVLGDQPGTVEADGTERPYTAVSETTDDSLLYNDIQNTRTGGTLQEATDDASIAKFLFPRSYSRSDLLNISDADALNWAQYVLYLATQVDDRFDSITLTPQRDPNMWPDALSREIGDLVEVWRRPPSVAGFSKQCLVKAITHAWDISANSWATGWTLQNTTRLSFLTLNDPILGRLNYNALAY